MPFRRWTLTLASLTLLTLAAHAEELDNQNLLKQIEGGISYKVLSNIITKSPNDCHFTDDGRFARIRHQSGRQESELGSRKISTNCTDARHRTLQENRPGNQVSRPAAFH